MFGSWYTSIIYFINSIIFIININSILTNVYYYISINQKYGKFFDFFIISIYSFLVFR